MPTPTFQPPQGNQSTAQIQDWIIKLVRDLNYLLGNLDTLNVNRLDAKVLIAASITAGKIAADSITANELAANSVTASEISAGAVTASKINVSQLSAITADMGHITAGDINITTDARIGNVLYLKETDASGTKGIIFSTVAANSAKISVLSGDMEIRTDGFITLTIGSSQGLVVNKKVVAPSFEASSSITLGGSSVLTSGASSSYTSVADGHNHGFSNTDYIQCYDAVGTPTLKKQWVAYTGSASHNHYTS